MPVNLCFSYPADPALPGLRQLPLLTNTEERYMPTTLCFSYPGTVPPGQRGGTNSACFGYPADELPGQPGGKTTGTCFRY